MATAPPDRVIHKARVAAALTALALLTPAGANALPAPQLAAADETAVVELRLAPEDAGLSRPGQPVVVTGTISNVGQVPLAAGVVDIAIEKQVADHEELTSAFEDPQEVDAEVVASVDTPPVAASGSAQLSVTIDPARLDQLLAGTGWGAHVLTATMREVPSSSSASALVRLEGEQPAVVDAAVVLPITVEPGVDGLLSAEELEEATQFTGVLTRKLEAAVANPDITVALDPRILASIRVLGTSAPETALEWLSRLEAIGNDVFPLQYADSDLALQRAAGASAPLQPTSFGFALDIADFPASTAGTPTESAPTASPTPTATTEPQPTLPSAEDLLAFDYASTDISWPAAGFVDVPDLAFGAAAGLTRTIVSESQFEARPDSSVVEVDGASLLVSDAASSAVSDAVFAVGPTASRFETTRAAALLAAAATDADGARTEALLTLDRSGVTGADMSTPLSTLLSLPWVAGTNVPQLLTGSAESAQFLPAVDNRGQIGAALLADEAAIGSFSSVLDDPTLLTGPARLDLLAAMSAGWAAQPLEWDVALSGLRAETQAVLTSVSIDASSQIIVASFTADTPIYVSNSLPYPVNVVVTPRASNGRIIIERGTATIEPESTSRVMLQARAVANGRVTVELNLTSPTGVVLGPSQFVQLDVQPFWETAGIAVIGALVVFLLAFGTLRSLRRRRREKDADAVNEADTE